MGCCSDDESDDVPLTATDDSYEEFLKDPDNKPISFKDAYEESTTYELVAGRTCYSGDFKEDYVFHIKNEHPWMSICFCHKENDYSKCERASVMFMVSCFYFAMALAVAYAEQNAEKNEYVSERKAFEVHQGMTFIFITLPGLILQNILIFIASLDYYSNERCNCLTTTCRNLVFIPLALVLFLVACFMPDALKDKDPDFDTSTVTFKWVSAQVQAVFTWFVTDLFVGTIPCKPLYAGFILKHIYENDHCDETLDEEGS